MLCKNWMDYMASSSRSGQDEACTAFCLASLADKMGPACPFLARKEFFGHIINALTTRLIRSRRLDMSFFLRYC